MPLPPPPPPLKEWISFTFGYPSDKVRTHSSKRDEVPILLRGNRHQDRKEIAQKVGRSLGRVGTGEVVRMNQGKKFPV